jgi:hypothetical protein
MNNIRKKARSTIRYATYRSSTLNDYNRTKIVTVITRSVITYHTLPSIITEELDADFALDLYHSTLKRLYKIPRYAPNNFLNILIDTEDFSSFIIRMKKNLKSKFDWFYNNKPITK